MDELSFQLNLSLSLLQGIALNHESSKEFLGRKCSLEARLLVSLFAPCGNLTAFTDSTRPPFGVEVSSSTTRVSTRGSC